MLSHKHDHCTSAGQTTKPPTREKKRIEAKGGRIYNLSSPQVGRFPKGFPRFSTMAEEGISGNILSEG